MTGLKLSAGVDHCRGHLEGVITPPASDVDPGIVQPTPDTGETKMPAIPPPGTPGGDPNVRPQ
jgi:hypothetical protein